MSDTWVDVDVSAGAVWSRCCGCSSCSSVCLSRYDDEDFVRS
jgi:hypothetical protein